MNQDETKLFFNILRTAISGNLLKDEEIKAYSSDKLPELIKTASKHDISHLLVFGLKQNKLIPVESTEIENHIYKAVYRYELLQYEYKTIRDLFEERKIKFIPLKGAVIRGYYPEPWMRTSCDIDILVPIEEIEKAESILVEKYGYKHHRKGGHDISLFSISGVHLELHYNLIDDDKSSVIPKTLNDVWNSAVLQNGFNYLYEMPDDVFYLYHIAHMAKHFACGGCGIRPFIDLWILDGFQNADKEKRDSLLASCNLLKFANSVRKLSSVWFGDSSHDLVTKQMEEYTLCGGLYGNTANRIMIDHQRKGGRIKYAFSKIFIPYSVIKYQYPILQKHKWLTPFMQVRRWFRIIFCGHLKRVIKELRFSNTISKEEATTTKTFLKNIGL